MFDFLSVRAADFNCSSSFRTYSYSSLLESGKAARSYVIPLIRKKNINYAVVVAPWDNVIMLLLLMF